MQKYTLIWWQTLQKLMQSNDKLWLQFHKSFKTLVQGIIIGNALSYLPYYVHTYVLFWFVSLSLVICVRSLLYEHIYRGIFRGCDSMYTSTFSRNIQACASVHNCTLNRNVCALASTIIRAHASTGILDFTSFCLFVHAHPYARICARAPASIRSCGGCYACLSVFLSIIFMWKLYFQWQNLERIYWMSQCRVRRNTLGQHLGKQDFSLDKCFVVYPYFHPPILCYLSNSRKNLDILMVCCNDFYVQLKR